MKLSDYVIDFLVKQNIHHAFLVSGGAVIHLVDSAARHPQIQPICVQHEQFGAASADGYARVTGNLGLMMVTSGPGATNIVTSVCNAYFDSIPVIYLTGQVARFRIKQSKKLRQKGFQETDVVSIFEDITKYVTLITDPTAIRYELEKAIYMAREGRPGPVVLDIPDDLQREEIQPSQLKSFIPPNHSKIESHTQEIDQLIKSAKKPLLILGAGIHISKSEKEVLAFARMYHLPILFTWGAADLLPHNDPLNMGCIGVCGPRAGNFAVQNADLIIAMGTRLSQMITGGKQSLFSPHSKKVMVDIDPEELEKFNSAGFSIDWPILADLKFFLKSIQRQEEQKDQFSVWRNLIHSWKRRYPLFKEENIDYENRVNPYFFIKKLSQVIPEKSIVIGDTGANISWTMQAFETKMEQKIFSAWNHTPMGYSLPASIGASLATKEEVICLIGDGGLMMCLQELATVRRYNLPVKIFIFDNQGHGIQKQTIDTWLHSHYVAVDYQSGLYFPNYQALAHSFDLPFFEIKRNKDLCDLQAIFATKGPWVCNVKIIENQKIVPMLKFGAGLEDLDPKLPEDELQQIKEESKLLETTIF